MQAEPKRIPAPEGVGQRTESGAADAFFVCCERLDRLCRPPFSKETNEQALALLRQMHSILTDGWDGPPEPESKESIDTLESTVEEPKPRKRLFGLRR